jgi:hypothetical protein
MRLIRPISLIKSYKPIQDNAKIAPIAPIG